MFIIYLGEEKMAKLKKGNVIIVVDEKLVPKYLEQGWYLIKE